MIISCGDSFFYGCDLQNANSTWPAQIAQTLGHDYKCYAKPGVGNLQILQQLISAQQHYGKEAIYAINWTWIDRFDYVSIEDELWHTVRPNLDNAIRDPIYYRYFHSELADKFTNLIYIAQSINLLKGHRYIITYMDHLLLDQQWHCPNYVRVLQDQIIPHLKSFDGETFLEWSRRNNYAESNSWHPLEQAHTAAANWWLPTFKELLPG